MAGLSGTPLAWTIPAFGMSETMARPVNKSPLDTNRMHSGTNFAADEANDRAARITNFQNYMGANPGAAPGGTGSTGLRENDGAGWARLMEQQQQYLKDIAAEAGKAGPAVRVGAYDGAHLPQPTGAPKMPSPSASAAMKGLSTAMDAGGRLPQIINDDPTLYHAYEMMLLDQMQGAGREARMTALSPGDEALMLGDTRINDLRAGDRQFQREQGDLDIMQKARSGYHAWDSYGRPREEFEHGQDVDLVDAKGKAATLDDIIRGLTARSVAETNAGVQDRRTESQATTAAMQGLQREVGNQRQYSRSGVDPNALGELNARLGVGGGAPRPGGAGTGTPATPMGGGKTISRQRAMEVQQQNGWDDATLAEMLRQYGYTVQ